MTTISKERLDEIKTKFGSKVPKSGEGLFVLPDSPSVALGPQGDIIEVANGEVIGNVNQAFTNRTARGKINDDGSISPIMDDDIEAFFSDLETGELSEGERDLIKERERKRVQTQLDAIDESIDSILQREREAGQVRAGRTRAVASRSGLLGSDFGEADIRQDAERTEDILNTRERQRGILKAKILSKAESRADEKIEDEIKQRRLNAEQVIEFKIGKRQEARDDIVTLAKAGVGPEDLNEEEFNNLLSQTGYSPLVLDAVMNQNQPATQKAEYKYTNLGDGRVLRTGVDAEGNPIEEQVYNYGLEADEEFKVTNDGTPLIVKKKNGVITEVKIADGFSEGQFARETGRKDDEDDESFSFSSKDKNKLRLFNFTDEEIDSIESDIEQFGINEVLEGIDSPEAKATLRSIFSGNKPNEELKFIDEDYFKEIFDEDTLRKQAKEAGFTKKVPAKGIFGLDVGLTVNEGDIDAYLSSLMKTIELERRKGKTDAEILEEMQSDEE